MTLAGRLVPAHAARAACVAVLLAVAGTLVVTAQTSPPPQAQQRPPVFRGGANFVYVDAYPRRDGRVVEGLTEQDFQVLEDGVPQKLESLQFIRVEPTPDAERRDPNNTREMLAQVADPTRRAFVVFLDYLHVTVAGSHDIRLPLTRTLNRIIAPNDLFAVTTPNERATQVTFGRRTLSVEDQLARNWPWGARDSILTDRLDPMEELLRSCFQYQPADASGGPMKDWLVTDQDGARMRLDLLLIQRRREDRTLTSLEQLMDYLGTIREARTVMLIVSDGWRLFGPDRGLAEQATRAQSGAGIMTRGGQLQPAGGRGGLGDPGACGQELLRLADLDDQYRFRELLTRANRANVSVCPITPGGIAAFDTSISEPALTMSDPTQSALLAEQRRVGARVSGLQTIAENTDGVAIVNTNDLDEGLARIVNDVSAYYLLGYYSTNTTFDGKYRKIEVTVGAPDVEVKARRGYYAPDEKARAAAAAAPAEAVGGLAPEAEAALGALGRLRPDAEIFTRALSTGDAVWVTAELGRVGRGRTWAGSGATARITITTDAGDVVGEWTGAIAANTRGALAHVAVPAGTNGPFKATVAIGEGIDRIQDQVAVDPPPDGVVGPALIYRARPSARSALYPVADQQFRRTERVHVEWLLGGALDDRTARLLGRDGQPLPVPVTLTERAVDGATRLAADLNLQPLTDGDYFIELTAQVAGATVRRWVAIKVSN
ncbi:MAG: VWA domain-containing protein [Vicinamibacterales bacterium]